MAMAQLIVDHNSRHALRPLNGPLLIGRASDSQVLIDEPGVLPVHAVILHYGDAYFIRNNGETWVNDEPVNGSHPLRDLDQIRVGTARLTFRLGPVIPRSPNSEQRQAGLPDFEFCSDTNGNGHLRAEHAPVAPETAHQQVPFIALACQCGAQLRAPARFAGRQGRCPRCQRKMIIPGQPEGAPHEALPTARRSSMLSGDSRVARDRVCGYCECPLGPNDQQLTCDRCGLPYHLECWNENLGCSAYGCPNVNILKQGPDIDLTSMPISQVSSGPPPLLWQQAQDIPQSRRQDETPWEFVFLGASTLSLLLSLFLFGCPSLIVAFVGARLLAGSHLWFKTPIVGLSFVLCIVGFIAGLTVSLNLY